MNKILSLITLPAFVIFFPPDATTSITVPNKNISSSKLKVLLLKLRE